jgi:hypothetical protein
MEAQLQHTHNGTTADAAVRRGRFGEIFGKVAGRDVTDIVAEFEAALPEEMASFDNGDRGDAINHDLYGYDAARGLAVIQVRHAFRRARNHFLNVRKSYFLVGYTETGEPFRHPVGAGAVRAAVRKYGDDPAEVVRAAERWVFNVTPNQYARSIRQGDVLMFQARGTPGETAEDVGTRLTVLDTHEVRAEAIKKDGRGEVWAYDPAVYHLENDHAPVYADGVDEWWIVRPGREATAWDFAQRLGD